MEEKGWKKIDAESRRHGATRGVRLNEFFSALSLRLRVSASRYCRLYAEAALALRARACSSESTVNRKPLTPDILNRLLILSLTPISA